MQVNLRNDDDPLIESACERNQDFFESQPNHGLKFSFDGLFEENFSQVILPNLFSDEKENILYTLDKIKMNSSIPGRIEQLNEECFQRILFLANVENLPPEFIEIQKIALECIFSLLYNSEIFNSIDVYSQIEFCPIIVHQLPSLYCPLILQLMFEVHPELTEQVAADSQFIYAKINSYLENDRIESYAVFQTVSFLFQYGALPDEDAHEFIILFCTYLSKIQALTQNIGRLFIYNFFRQLKEPKYFAMLSETDFFKKSVDYFTNLTYIESSQAFRDYLFSYLNKENYLTKKGFLVNFNTESIRDYIIEIFNNYIDAGFRDDFAEKYSLQLLGNATSIVEIDRNGGKPYYIDKLRSIIIIANKLIPVSPEYRKSITDSRFYYTLQTIMESPSYQDQECILFFLSSFVPFESSIIDRFFDDFELFDLLRNMISTTSSIAINSCLDLFSIVLRPSETQIQNENNLELLSILQDDDTIEVLDHLLSHENQEIVSKSQQILDAIKSMQESS